LAALTSAAQIASWDFLKLRIKLSSLQIRSFMATATGLFKEHFWSPASATWTDLKNGTQNSITKADISGYLWNSLVCTAPLIVGGGTAYTINRYVHNNFVSKLDQRPVAYSFASLLATTGSVIVGATVSFFAIRLLSANGATLSPFTAEKALKLETLHVVSMAAITPISMFFRTPILQFFQVPMFFGAAAVSGYFGERSLYVIGALSALTFAVQAAFTRPDMMRWKEDDLG
jgi:hypothetical protein